MKKKNKSKINCDVEDCKYNNEEGECALDEITVTYSSDSDDQVKDSDDTACDSFDTEEEQDEITDEEYEVTSESEDEDEKKEDI